MKILLPLMISILSIVSCKKSPTSNEVDLTTPQIKGYVRNSQNQPIRSAEVHVKLYYELEPGSNSKSLYVPPSSLYQNRPNPFQSSTEIQYDLEEEMHTKLIVFSWPDYDTLSIVVDEIKQPGSYHVTYRPEDKIGNKYPCGIYPYQLILPDTVIEKEMFFIISGEEVLATKWIPHTETDSQGSFIINYKDLPFGRSVHDTGMNGQDYGIHKILDDTLRIILVKDGFQPSFFEIMIDTTSYREVTFNLLEQ
ncbi:hypothetical protein JW979_08660 [bacterium]|nr:hypothetical protein [candidate division CSSED10-310 bacterium]